MGAYLARRLMVAALTFVLITVITFCVIRLAPGEPFADHSGAGSATGINEATLKKLRARYHLDEPLLAQYGHWARSVVTLDFGTSFHDGRKVTEKVFEGLKVSVFLSACSLSLAYLVAVPLGIWSAVRHGAFVDRGVGLVLFVLYSLPNFWVATMLIVYFGGGRHFDVFPIAWLSTPGAEDWPFFQWLGDRVHHLILPVACLTYQSLAGLSRYARSGMLEVIRQDYVRTARAKGLPETVVVLKHVARNGLIPLVTLLAYILPALVGGSVIIETIFSLPGMGQLAFSAILARDYPVVMATLTFSALLTLVGFLLSDVLYVLVDPRISFERAAR